ncbi:MAG: hypothetical protein KAT16_07330 [Candidatus Heimdallarchaeota archaeon]|nr:hypothetical protein [Candidatus Heimdallarchaeota archaeon]
MNRRTLISGLIVLGLIAVVATTVAVNGSVFTEPSETVRIGDGTCDGTDPHGQGNGNGGNGPKDGTGNHWRSQGPHGDGTCNQTDLING